MSGFVTHLVFSRRDVGKVTWLLSGARRATVTEHSQWTARSWEPKVTPQPSLGGCLNARLNGHGCYSCWSQGDPGGLAALLAFPELRRAGFGLLGLEFSFTVCVRAWFLCLRRLICAVVIPPPTSQGGYEDSVSQGGESAESSAREAKHRGLLASSDFPTPTEGSVGLPPGVGGRGPRSAQAAMTKSHRLGGLNNRRLFSHGSGGWVRLGVLAWPGSGENPLPGADSCLLAVCSQPSLGARAWRELSLFPFL